MSHQVNRGPKHGATFAHVWQPLRNTASLGALIQASTIHLGCSHDRLSVLGLVLNSLFPARCPPQLEADAAGFL